MKNDDISGPTILWREMKGKKVKSVDGEKLGNIEKISQNYVMIEEGLANKKRFWIPKFLADFYDGKFLWLHIKNEEIKQKYYYDKEPESSGYDLDLSEFNTIYDKNENSISNEKIKLKEVSETKSTNESYRNIRNLK